MHPKSPLAPARPKTSPLHRLLVALLATLVALPVLAAPAAAAELNFDEALAQLSAEEFSQREAGEAFLRALSLDDAPRLEPLLAAADPEVAFRARRALLWVRLRLNDSFPAELAAKIAALPEMSRRETRSTIAELLGLNPPALITLAGLHTELLTNAHRYNRFNPETLKNLSNAVTVAASSKSETLQISQVRPQLYSDQTLALLADGFAKRHAGDLAHVVPVYSSWVAKRPAILPLLAGSAIPLEIARIQAQNPEPNKQIGALLTLAASYPAPSEQRKAVLARMTQTLRANPTFPIESLDREQGYTLFAALEENWDPQMDVSAYLKFRARFPEPRANSETSTLEVVYLLEKDGPNAALALALNQPKDHAAVWLGTWMQAHPEKIPNPLVIPELKKGQNRHSHTGPFLNALVPLRELREIESNPKALAAIEAILRDEQWLELALKANVGRIVYFEWIRKGTLDANIPKHLTGSTDRLRALGRLMISKPESMAMINPAHQTPLDLQRILLGMLEQPLTPAVAEVFFTHADEWVKLYPDMWKTDGFRFELPRIESMAANRTEALHKLLSLATKYPNQRADAEAGISPNPAIGVLLRSIKRYPEEALNFPTAKLTAEEGYLFFSVFATTPEAKKNFAQRYRAFRKRFSEPPPEPESLPLEAFIYLDAKQPNKAFALSLLQTYVTAAEWTGEWLNENPEALEKPLNLPNQRNRDNAHQKCRALLEALAPYRTLAECQAHPKQMAALKVLLDAPEWLDAAVRGEAIHLVFLHILLTGELDEMLAKRLAGQPEAATALGALFAQHPEALRSIKPENQSVATLQPFVLGLSQANPNPQLRADIDQILQNWAKAIPGVLDKPVPAPKPRQDGGQGFQLQLQMEIH